MTYRLPSLNTLRAFEAAGRHLSFKTAASELGVTPGAVSQQVKKLENSLGVALFRRLPHGLLLTRQGETYLPRIAEVFERLTEATEAIAPNMNGRKFTVGICPEAAVLLPPGWPGRFRSLEAHVREWVQISDIDAIRTDRIDCLLRRAGGPYGDLSVVTLKVPALNGPGQSVLNFVCKPGLSECRQTRAILDSLDESIGSP